MLYNLNGEEMTYMPHQEEYDLRRANLSDEDYYRVVDAINDYIDNSNGVFASSFIPGADWTDTPYQPLYLACNQSKEQSAMFFGQIVWQVVMDRDDEWLFKPPDMDADGIQGTTYWRRDR